MIAKELISDEIVPLRTSDTGEDGLAIMSEFHVRHLPIVNDSQLLGLISEEEIFEFDPEESIGSYPLKMSHPFVNDRDHIYDIMRLLNEYRLSLVPVVDKNKNYLGVVTLEDLLKFFAQSASFGEHGSVVVLTVNRYNYSLSQIARIVESENAIILNSFITSTPDSTELEITLKLNRSDISKILASFRRFDYDVKASFSELEYIDSLQEHYDSLMSYLSV
ncbi:MAG: CBS domain-containing protein [Saprospiraceae bacterium]|nr:CBS domain-containing protein [Saprospiraceae bacterium]